MDEIEKEIDEATFELSYAINQSGWSRGSLEARAAAYIEDSSVNDSAFENFFEWSLRDPAGAGHAMARIAEKHLKEFVTEYLIDIQQRFALGEFKEVEEHE